MSWALPLTNARITSGFGPRDINVPNASTFHRGVDLVNTDHRVMSVGSGSVLATGWNDYRGRWVAVRHTDGTTATYQHLASIAVSKGRSVSAGTFLGMMGNSSNPAVYQLGVHLHLEWFQVGRFLLNGDAFVSTDRAVDPIPQLKSRGVDLRVGVASNAVTTPTEPGIPLVPKLQDTVKEEDEMVLTTIICDQGVKGLEYGSTAVVHPLNGWLRCSTGTGPRDTLNGHIIAATALGWRIVERHVTEGEWTIVHDTTVIAR